MLTDRILRTLRTTGHVMAQNDRAEPLLSKECLMGAPGYMQGERSPKMCSLT